LLLRSTLKHFFEIDFVRNDLVIIPIIFELLCYSSCRGSKKKRKALSGSGMLNTICSPSQQIQCFLPADDMEPFRPLVDEAVLEIMQQYDEQ
jgi:hypothetical protein